MDKKVANSALTQLADAVEKCTSVNGITKDMIYATVESKIGKLAHSGETDEDRKAAFVGQVDIDNIDNKFKKLFDM